MCKARIEDFSKFKAVVTKIVNFIQAQALHTRELSRGVRSKETKVCLHEKITFMTSYQKIPG